MKNKCLVFGAGHYFEIYCSCIEEKYDILALIDNNDKLYGKHKLGYCIISPNDIKKYNYNVIVICSIYAGEIQAQLFDMGFSEIIIFKDPGIFLRTGTSCIPMDVRFYEKPFKKRSDKIHILFSQISPCPRTIRYADLLRKRNIDCSLAYFGILGNKNADKYFDQIIHFFSFGDFLDYVKESEYDLIHCSNEPDILTCLAIGCDDKPIVHDCHDFLTLRGIPTAETMCLELISNSRSDGYIYPSKQCLQIAIEKYNVEESKAIYFENFPSRDAIPHTQLRKLSSIDNKIHCVYEGAITDDRDSYRFFEDQWQKLSSQGIHIHFYTRFQEEYCKHLESLSENIHYEGNIDTNELLTLMTQYDLGLCTYRELAKDKVKLDTGTATKMYEYLAAGLPVALSNHMYHKPISEDNKIGKVLDWDGNIEAQLKSISEIQIPKDFVINNGFTMEDMADRLIKFYKEIILEGKK